MKNTFKAFVIVMGVISSIAIGVAQTRAKFEVVSIRPAGPSPAGTRGTGGGAPGRGAPATVACPYIGTRIDAGRISGPRINTFRLITWAYEPKGCVLEMGLVTGQPEWTRTELYAFEATMPAGTPAYTFDQLQSGDAPKLREMMQTMLEERFQLKVHREKKELAAYDLVVAKPGKMTPSKDQTPPPDAVGRGVITRPDGTLAPGLILLDGSSYRGTSITVAQLAGGFGARAARPVVDKTGLKGFFDIHVPIAPNLDPNPSAPARGLGGTGAGAGLSSMDAQVLDALGLKLVDSKMTADVIVIDSIEKPSEN